MRDILNNSTHYVKDKLQKDLYDFMSHESFGGILLFFCVIAAFLIANSQFSNLYFLLKDFKIGVFFGDIHYGMSILHIVNEIAMSFFFLMIGLEMKREILYGELVGFKKIAFPMLGAVGGIVAPIMIYIYFNYGLDSIIGFGVPMSTDTAFALGALLLLGSRVPISLKIFLVTLAVVDDLGAILVIVFFYTHEINTTWLLVAFLLFCILCYVNYRDSHRLWVYLFLGLFLWIAVFNSGIHATIAAVILAFTIPGRSRVSDKYLMSLKEELEKIKITMPSESSFFASSFCKSKSRIQCMLFAIKDFFSGDANAFKSFNLKEQDKRTQILDSIAKYSTSAQNPLISLQIFLHPLCSYFIVPIFAFLNAGVRLDSGLEISFNGIVAGTIAGLVIGKPLGILTLTYFGEKLGMAHRPKDISYWHIFAIGCLAGVGFTMSIFVANLAYDSQELIDLSKISTIYASSISLILGLVSLYLSTTKKQNLN